MQVFTGKQSWKGHPVEGKDVQSHCPEGLEYFGISKALGMRDGVVGNKIRERGKDWVMGR